MATAVEPVFSAVTIEQASVQTGTKKIRTVVVDDSETFLQVVCALLELDPLVDMVARADKGGEAIETVMKLKPDLILMDVHMPYLDGLTLAWFFWRRFPSARVVLMSTANTPELRAACEESGAMDFIHKENFRDEFRAVLKRVRGEEWQGTELNAVFSS
ncbi:MAG TPA: response regulator transcription factor [Candidatus Angelobacter sp.]|nr:response regulator transcription factor [Candidatus Angelobacter sp.]